MFYYHMTNFKQTKENGMGYNYNPINIGDIINPVYDLQQDNMVFMAENQQLTASNLTEITEADYNTNVSTYQAQQATIPRQPTAQEQIDTLQAQNAQMLVALVQGGLM